MASAHSFKLLRDVKVNGEGADAIYAADGLDPQMLWIPTPEARAQLLDLGAVRITVRIEALGGKITEPCVYVDWGNGFTEETRRTLRRSADGAYSVTARTNGGGCRHIRFDPTVEGATFRINAFHVEPAPYSGPPIRNISRAGRLARALLHRAPRPIQSALREFRAALAEGGLPTALAGRPRLGAGRNPWRQVYRHSFDVARQLRSPHFAAPPLAAPRRDPDDAKVVAFYLPQFHPIPQNDAWWGAGFTEWTNVSKATPQFVGHYQPRLPGELGYYDLRLPEVRRRQADLALWFGVDAFCFHYYWFAGERLLERPLDEFVADDTLDMPFALCWANENWTRRWDGQDNEILMAQRHSLDDDIAVFDDMARYIRSPRYLRSGGRPVLLIYRPDAMPDPAATVARWRDRAREIGLGELKLLCTNAFGLADYADLGFDGQVEFPPHAITAGEITDRVAPLNSEFSGRVYDYETVVAAKIEDLNERIDPNVVPGVMPAWDNEARKPGAGHAFHGATPEMFGAWTSSALACARRLAPVGDRLVFVNAWNEWAEGAYLEPDRWFGHAFGQALRSAIERCAPRITDEHPTIAASCLAGRSADTAILLHVYYSELIEDFAKRLAALPSTIDLVITFPDTWDHTELARLAAAFPRARLLPAPNVGRDVAPFLRALAYAESAGYAFFCKLHSKRSPHMAGGDLWRDTLVSGLLHDVDKVVGLFQADARLGFMATEASAVRFGEPGVLHNNQQALIVLAKQLGFKFDDETRFAGGTMFWGRVAAYQALIRFAPALEFEPEMGRIDGTLAHVLERAFAVVATSAGYKAEFAL